MRIHIQNPTGETLFAFSHAMWAAAAARASARDANHSGANHSDANDSVSIGTTAVDFTDAMQEAEALVADTATVSEHFPCSAPKLKLVFVTSAGLDRLAPFTWLPPGAELLNNRGAHATKSGEFGIMSLLMLASRIPQMVTHQRAGRWRELWGQVLAGRTLTLVGLGTLGGAVAEHAVRFGMVVTGVRASPAAHPHCARVIGTQALGDVLPQTDFLLLACPLTDATRNLMDRRRLDLLPPHAGLVNIGRGGLLDQDALCDMLDQGRLSGAVLDVFAPEPIPAGHRLWITPNLIISPHTSADDPATYNAHSLDIFLDNLRAWRDGRPLPNRFDIIRGY